MLVAALAGSALTARLGVWQLDRAAQKTALAAAMASRGRQPALPMDALATTPRSAQAQYWRQVRVRGRWLAARTIYLDNRQMDGRPGFDIVTPLVLAPGDGVLVQRGWVPRDPRERTALPPLVTPSGEVEVHGLIAPPPARLFEFQHGGSGPIRQNLDLAESSREIGIKLRPLSIWQTDDERDGLLRHWQRPAIDVSMHYGYAFQWFALCALIAGLYVWFQLLQPRIARGTD